LDGRIEQKGGAPTCERRSPERWSVSAWPASCSSAPGAVAQTTGDESSSTATTAQDTQQNDNGYGSGAADGPERNNGNNGSGDNTE
jgi:hypothetical protein